MSYNLGTIIKRGISQIKTYGISLLYWRYIYRRNILKSRPIRCPDDSEIEVHMQICPRDWLNGLWTLSSFSHFSESEFRLVLLHDGWMDEENKVTDVYNRQFPGVITYKRSNLKKRVKNEIFPLSPKLGDMWLQEKYFTLPKIVDSFLLKRNRFYIQLDPDILFFSHPHELIMGGNALNNTSATWNCPRLKKDADGIFSLNHKEVFDITGLVLPVPFGTGLGLIDSDKFDWDLFESVFSILDVPDQFLFMLDQTLFALIAAKYGYVKLPLDKYVIEPVESLSGVVARHYYSKTRDLMYIEGLKQLSQLHLF